jgi:hypothetical protein
VLEHTEVPGWVTASDGGFRLVAGGGRHAVRAHGGDPQVGRAAQVAGGSGVRAATCPLRLGGKNPQGGSAATVTAIMTALEAVTPGAGTESGSARIVVIRTVPGEKFDEPVEPVAAGHLIMAHPRGPSVERMVNRHPISAGSPQRTAPSWSR